jgi:replicative DNA helicase
MNKIPPQALDIEKSVLGSALIEKNVLDKFQFGLTEDCFYSTEHQKIYTAIVKLINQGKAVDVITVSEEMKNEPDFNINSIQDLIIDISTTKNIGHHIKILLEKSQHRKLIKLGSEVMDMGFNENVPSEIIAEIDKSIYDLQDEKANKTYSAYDTIGPTIEEIQQRMEGNNQPIKTHLDALDDRWGGLYPGEFTVIGARPGMGKTGLMIQFMRSIQEPGLIISLEMTFKQITERIISNISKVDKDKIRNGRVTKKEMNDIQLALNEIAGLKYLVNDYPYQNIYMIRSLIAQHIRQHKIKYVFVDYLQMIRDTGKFKDKRLETDEKSAMLKNISKEFNIHVIALAQLSRGVEARTNKRPMSSDLKESGSIEQDAHNIHFMYRDDYYKEDSDMPGVTEIITTKMREGRIGTGYLRFIPERAQFESIINSKEIEEIKNKRYTKKDERVF